MSVDMWNCHSWPLDVSNNLSEYFMSSSVPMHFAFGYHEEHWTVKRSLCALAVLNRGVHLPLVSTCVLCALVFPYIFLLNSGEITLVYDHVNWGEGGPSAFESQWHQWTVEITLCSGSVEQGGPSAFESQWHQWTVKRSLCALAVLNGGVHLPLVSTCFLYALVFPYIFLLVDCFEWALIGDIEKCRVHSVLCQFWLGGPSAFGIYMCSLCTGISLYFPISSLFQMGSHWWHWKA